MTAEKIPVNKRGLPTSGGKYVRETPNGPLKCTHATKPAPGKSAAKALREAEQARAAAAASEPARKR